MADADKKITRQEKIQIGIIVTTLIVIVVMIVAIMTLIKYAEEIRNNPIDYAIKHTTIKSCSCYDEQGREAYFGEPIDLDDPLGLLNKNG